jgi:hypothetical protein
MRGILSQGYDTTSIASIGPSTLEDAKVRPKVAIINRPAEVFSDDHGFRSSGSRPLFNDTSDIAGACPKIPRERNYVSKILEIDDIEGTRPKMHDKFLQTKRHINPLKPEYKLPETTIADYETPKFIKDSLLVDDIDGTRTRQRKVVPNRDGLHIDDIEGTRSGWKPRHM